MFFVDSVQKEFVNFLTLFRTLIFSIIYPKYMFDELSNNIRASSSLFFKSYFF